MHKSTATTGERNIRFRATSTRGMPTTPRTPRQVDAEQPESSQRRYCNQAPTSWAIHVQMTTTQKTTEITLGFWQSGTMSRIWCPL